MHLGGAKWALQRADGEAITSVGPIHAVNCIIISISQCC